MNQNEGNKTISTTDALRGFRPLLRAGEIALQARYDRAAVQQIVSVVEREFISLVPDIPYVGGSRNPFSGLVVNAAGILAMHRALREHGITGEDFGKLLEEIAILHVEKYPRWIRMIMGRLWMSPVFRRVMDKRARFSQKRRYKGDFVYEVIPGNASFQWGINYLECGIVKFLHRHGEAELARQACILDYVMFPALGVTLQRTGTIAQGCEMCDFRFR